MKEDLGSYPLRSKIYKILSRCFCYPSEDLFHYARMDLLTDMEKSLKKLPYGKNIKREYETFRTVLLEKIDKFSLDDLQVEYTRLFIYAHGGPSCSPYESIYRGTSRHLMSDSTMAIKEIYQRFELSGSPQFSDLPDHIAAELEFMHFLSHNEEIAAEKGDT